MRGLGSLAAAVLWKVHLRLSSRPPTQNFVSPSQPYFLGRVLEAESWGRHASSHLAYDFTQAPCLDLQSSRHAGSSACRRGGAPWALGPRPGKLGRLAATGPATAQPSGTGPTAARGLRPAARKLGGLFGPPGLAATHPGGPFRIVTSFVSRHDQRLVPEAHLKAMRAAMKTATLFAILGLSVSVRVPHDTIPCTISSAAWSVIGSAMRSAWLICLIYLVACLSVAHTCSFVCSVQRTRPATTRSWTKPEKQPTMPSSSKP